MGRRQELHNLLLTITPKVYFQPPANVTMEYPCILYKRDAVDTKFADDSPYLRTVRYQVTVIDRDPDSDIPDAVAKLRLCSFAQHFVAENLYHDVYSLYF